MRIDWLGHSCFKVTLKTGTVILFDPFDSTVGYAQQEVKADIVVISHAHFDHNDLSHIRGKFKVVDTAGVHEFDGITLEGIKTWHDHSAGETRGENLAFLLKVNGLRLCHMGDVGCVPDADVLEKLKGIEILLVPVGGNGTIDANEAMTIIDAISPNIIIPMHFKTPETKLRIASLHGFLELANGIYDISHPGKAYLTIDKATLKKRTRVVVMEYL
jgi:L-ascorbate metabolism protein UlaG (beta-lactamase superfamily)